MKKIKEFIKKHKLPIRIIAAVVFVSVFILFLLVFLSSETGIYYPTGGLGELPSQQYTYWDLIRYWFADLFGQPVPGAGDVELSTF